MKKSIILVAVGTLSAGSFTIARADTTLEPRTVTVRYADLDTANPKGAAVLYRRLNFAAATVCQDLSSRRELSLVRLHAECVQRALSNAVAKVDDPAVTAYAATRGVHLAAVDVRIADSK